MTKILLRFTFLTVFLSLFISSFAQDCTIQITRPSADTIICRGDSLYLRSSGSCDVFLNNNFENGLGVGWSQANANPIFMPYGCDEEHVPNMLGPEDTYLWIGATDSPERSIITDTFDVSVGGCFVKFWMRYGTQDGNGTCEDPGPQLGEGVNLQYSIDDGFSWTNFPDSNNYAQGPNTGFPPYTTTVLGSGGYWETIPGGHTNARYDTNSVFWWHEYSCQIPAVAETNATRFKFAQNGNSGAGWDTWGLDEVKIFCSNNQNVVWSHGPTEFNPVDPVAPTDSTLYWVMVSDTAGNFARDTVIVYVADRPNTDLGPDTTICWTGSNTAVFDAGAGFDSYTWNTGETTQIIYPDTSGTFIVKKLLFKI